jgi:hypothetical protein
LLVAEFTPEVGKAFQKDTGLKVLIGPCSPGNLQKRFKATPPQHGLGHEVLAKDILANPDRHQSLGRAFTAGGGRDNSLEQLRWIRGQHESLPCISRPPSRSAYPLQQSDNFPGWMHQYYQSDGSNIHSELETC